MRFGTFHLFPWHESKSQEQVSLLKNPAPMGCYEQSWLAGGSPSSSDQGSRSSQRGPSGPARWPGSAAPAPLGEEAF